MLFLTLAILLDKNKKRNPPQKIKTKIKPQRLEEQTKNGIKLSL